jgi:maltooligosyltrehalose trehalohydrolase
VRRYFVDNALYWLTEYHVDGLRLDAVHGIIDTGPRHILEELSGEFRRQSEKLGRLAYTIAESDLNDVRIIKPADACGFGIDAQWSDDFHHSLHALMTKNARGYFADFGPIADLAKAIEKGFVYDGRRSAYRGRMHGNSSAEMRGEQFVICIQNHDQIANGYWGDRLASLLTLEQQKVAAAIMLCAPNVPMLFMGQEWGETAPFLYFTSHTDDALGRAVREGRSAEYASFVKEEGETVSALGGFADPQDAETFEQSKLVWSRLEASPHAELLRFYRELIETRKKFSCLSNCDKRRTRVSFDEAGELWMVVERGDVEDNGDGTRNSAEVGTAALLFCNLSDTAQKIPAPTGEGAWRLTFWSGAPEYGGSVDAVRPPQRVGAAMEGNGAGVELGGWTAALYISERVEQ